MNKITTFKLQNGDEMQAIGFGPGIMGYSAKMAKKRRTATYQILKCALLFATISGTTVALILFFGGNFFV